MEKQKQELTLPFGVCHWFAKANSNSQSPCLRKCRNGFMCRYAHLCMDEVEQIIKSGKDLMDCPCCLQRKQPIPESLSDEERLMEEVRRMMPCFNHCTNGKLTIQRYILAKSRERLNDCECPSELSQRYGATYYPKTSKNKAANCWICNRCHCIQSIG